ncbi:MAG: NAD-dependent epimerase/dehydratase family protein [Candidatus Izemoplasmatales bacterium]
MIYITGATGHIGNNLAREMSKQAIDFRLLLRQPSNAVESFKDKIIICDIFDTSVMEKIVRSGDTLIHLAANIDLQNNQLEECILVNDFGTRALIDLAVQKQLYFIYTSSVDIIERDDLVGEIHEPTSIQLTQKSNYAFTKAKATKYLLDIMKKKEIQATIFYPTAVIGPHDYKPSEAGKEIIKAMKKHVFFNIHGGYNFIDVRDVSHYIIEAYKNRITGSYILGNKPLTIHYLYSQIARFSNIQPHFIYIPKWLAYLGLLFTKQYTRVMLDAVYDNYNYNTHHTDAFFQTRPRPIEDTLHDTLYYFNELKSD